MSRIHKAYSADVEMIGERTIRVIASTGSVDMMGDVVVQEGGDLSVFRRNPIVLFSHNPEMPVGTAPAVGLQNGKLVAEIEFAAPGLSHKADEICGLVKAGILKSVSIGFDPVEQEPLIPSRPRGPQKYLKWVLCEISVVAIPANTEAVVTEKALGEIPEAPAVVPAAPVVKTVSGLKFKGLYDIGCLAQLMCGLGWAHDMACWEKACEGDDSAVPAQLAAVIHSLGEALVAMTQEEVAECLACVDGRDDGGTEKSTAPLVRKFKAGAMAVKSGRAVSKATAQTIQDAMDSHDMAQASHKVLAKCLKALADSVPEFANTPNQPANTPSQGKSADTSKTQGAATPGTTSGDTAGVLQDVADAAQAHEGSMKIHAKCMKSMADLVNDTNGTLGDGSQPYSQTATPGKGLDLQLTKEQRIKRARVLAVSRA